MNAVGTLAGTDLHLDDPAIAELAPGSDLLGRARGPTAAQRARFVSIAAQGDAAVPSPDAHLDGAANVIVPVRGIGAHADLPGSTLVTREASLALAGRPPSCESAPDAVLDVVWGDVFHSSERFLTATRVP